MKSILLICPDFFGYNKMIKSELLNDYDKVILFPEYPLVSPRIYKLLNKISSHVLCYLWSKYESKVTKMIEKNFVSTILIIKGAYLRESFLQSLSKLSVNIVHYQWDSVSNNNNALMISRYATRNYTFDMNDSENFGFVYLPLFYCWSGVDNNTLWHKQFDILYVGSWSLNRIKELRNLHTVCVENSLSIYSHIYISLFSYLKKMFIARSVPFKDVKFRILSRSRYFSLLKSCKVVFDIPSSTQVGCSMRTMEALSLSKKIVTSNSHITKESFYSKDNFLIWPYEKDRIKEFIYSPFSKSSKEKVLSLRDWLCALGVL